MLTEKRKLPTTGFISNSRGWGGGGGERPSFGANDGETKRSPTRGHRLASLIGSAGTRRLRSARQRGGPVPPNPTSGKQLIGRSREGTAAGAEVCATGAVAVQSRVLPDDVTEPA